MASLATSPVVLFVALSETESNSEPGVTEIPLQMLPRRCPYCGQGTIIGHGRRFKQAHDQRRQGIWIRRAICRPCQKTFTVLPDWSPPSGHYSLHCRQQPWELLRQAGGSWERSVPDVADATRSPDRLPYDNGLIACCIWEPCWQQRCGTPPAGPSRLHPPSLPGIGWRSAVFCRWRRTVHESAATR